MNTLKVEWDDPLKPNGEIVGYLVTYETSEQDESEHNSPIYDEFQSQSAWVLALLWERVHQDDSNDTPQPISEFQVDFPLLWIKAYPGLS